MKLVAGVSTLPGAGSGYTLGQPPNSEMSTVGFGLFDDARMNKLFSCRGRKMPHWKDVIYGARHNSSIVGFQMAQLAQVQAMIRPVVDFEIRPGRWVKAADFVAEDDRQALAADIALRTWGMFRSPAGNQSIALKQAAEVHGTVGEGYGIEHVGRNGKPAVSIVHCPAVEVQKDGSIKWTRRAGGKPEIVPRARYERLYREDETFVDDCTSPWRHIVHDLICFEIINAALKKAVTSDMLLRGLIWAPGNGPNEQAQWVGGYLDLVEDVLRDPDLLGGLMPYPVASGSQAPVHVDMGTPIHETLIKAHDLYVKKIAQASVFPAQLVLEGPGAGNAYADHALRREFLQFTAAPPLAQYVYPDLAAWWWHPKLDANPEYRGTGIESCRFRLTPDISTIANRPDSRKELLDARKTLVPIRDEAIAESLGLGPEDLYKPGTPEYEEWIELQLLLRGSEPNQPGSPPVVDPGNGVPETDGFTLGDPLGPRFAELGALW